MLAEALEARALLSVVHAGELLEVTGTAGNDRIELARRGEQIVVRVNGETRRFNAAEVDRVRVSGGDGDDEIRAGRLSAAPTVTRFSTSLDGGPGNDRLFGAVGHNHMVGGLGADRIFGGDDNDLIYAGVPGSRRSDHAADTLNGAGGADAAYYQDRRDIRISVEDARASLTPLNPPPEVVHISLTPSRAGAHTKADIAVTFGTGNPFFRLGELTRDGSRLQLEVLSFRRHGMASRQAPVTHARRLSLGELQPGQFTLELVGHAGQVLKSRSFEVR